MPCFLLFFFLLVFFFIYKFTFFNGFQGPVTELNYLTLHLNIFWTVVCKWPALDHQIWLWMLMSMCQLTSYLGRLVWSCQCGEQRRTRSPHGRRNHIFQNPSECPEEATSTESGQGSSHQSAAQIHPQYVPQEPAWHPLDTCKIHFIMTGWISNMVALIS